MSKGDPESDLRPVVRLFKRFCEMSVGELLDLAEGKQQGLIELFKVEVVALGMSRLFVVMVVVKSPGRVKAGEVEAVMRMMLMQNFGVRLHLAERPGKAGFDPEDDLAREQPCDAGLRVHLGGGQPVVDAADGGEYGLDAVVL